MSKNNCKWCSFAITGDHKCERKNMEELDGDSIHFKWEVEDLINIVESFPEPKRQALISNAISHLARFGFGHTKEGLVNAMIALRAASTTVEKDLKDLMTPPDEAA